MPLKPILLKLSGTLFANKEALLSVIAQIKTLHTSRSFGIVIGGGNFFRGSQHGKHLGLKQVTADAVGMLATNMNGLILRDLCEASGIPCLLVSANPVHGLINPIDPHVLQNACTSRSIVIFAGGSGNPFCTTDTTAVIRALQINASEVWKATNVDGIYDSNPATNPQAALLPTVSYEEYLENKLQIMDSTSITMAQEHRLAIRVFNIFAPNALLQISRNKNVGSTIS